MANILDQSYDPTTNFEFQLRFASNNGVKAAQGFTPTITAKIPSIELKLDKNGTPSGNIWVTIEANNAGAPSGTPLATSSNVAVTGLGVEAFTPFTFATPVQLTSGVLYWAVLQGDFAFSTSNNIGVRTRQQASDGYVSGPFSLNDGTNWVLQDGGGTFYDQGFKEYYDDTTIAQAGAPFLLNFI